MNIVGHLREKKGLYYAVITYQTVNGQKKEKWHSTKLKVRGNKKKAEDFLREIKRDFIVPTSSDGNITSTNLMSVSEAETTISADLLKEMPLDDLTNEQVSNMLFADYMVKYLPLTRKRKKKISLSTYSNYCNSVKFPIAPYFRRKGITLGDLKPEDIQEFYDNQLQRVKATTIIRYHVIIRLALSHARKKGYIKVNPIEEVDVPEKEIFRGKFYSDDEVNQLIALTRNTKLELPTLFGAFYGLRRSEILGLRWSEFDFKNNKFYINHTVLTPRIDGKVVIDVQDKTKSAASTRALPLSEDFKERLLEIKEIQESYQKKFKRSYSKKWLGYVMVDPLGELTSPEYISRAFRQFLEKNGLRRIRFHDLRHTCASLLLNKGKEDGVTMRDIQEWLGHAQFTTTANTYAHLDSNSKTASLSTLSGVVRLKKEITEV